MSLDHLRLAVVTFLLLVLLFTFLSPYIFRRKSWQFRICPDNLNLPYPHAHFYGPGKQKTETLLFSMDDGTWVMNDLIAMGEIPVSDRETLTTQIRESGLPEDAHGGFAL